MHAATLVLTAQLVLVSIEFSAHALTPPPPSIDVVLNFDFNTAKGFEKSPRMLGGDFGNTPEFVLGQGKTATMNLTFTAYKETDFIKENDTAQILSIWYGGNAANNYKGGGGYTSLPNGIVASIKPQNLTLPPDYSATVTLQISAAPNTTVRSYDMDFSFRLKTPSYIYGTTPAYNTILRIVESNTSSISTTNTTANRSTSLWSGQVVTSTTIPTITKTQTETVTSTTTQVSTITSTMMTALQTFSPTSTITTSVLGKQTADTLPYIWAVGATITTIVLAAVIVLQRRMFHFRR